MSTAETRIGLADWSLGQTREPVVRIGVVLDEDDATSLQAVIPSKAYVLVDASGETRLPPGSRLAVHVDKDACVYAVDDGAPARANSLHLMPMEPESPVRGGGVLVHDLIAGRGFHWQRRVDQTLAGTLEVRAGKSGVVLVNELPLEHYLAGVITAEMSGACPPALLEAQCIVARSWLLAMTELKHVGEPFDRCNDDCCQRYQGTGDLTEAAIAAVRSTRGRVLLDAAGDVLDANYAKSCGGISEQPRLVWGVDKPGLSSVIDAPESDPVRSFNPVTEANLDTFLRGDWLADTRAWCSPNVVPVSEIGRYLGRVDAVDDYFRWEVRYTADELAMLLREKLEGAEAMAEVVHLSVVRRGVSGRAGELRIDWRDRAGQDRATVLGSEYAIRAALHRGFLYSSAFEVDSEYADGRRAGVTLRGAGWGHGVGLCQIGALGMSLRGADSSTICRHYYPSATLAAAYD